MHLSLRERNKLEKLRRIKAAARQLFMDKGFDDATVREIAAVADVGMGTIFLYADNKRDLLFLIANDELDEIKNKAVAGFRPDAHVLTNLLRTFRLHYEFFGAQPELSRFKLREMMFYDSGRQAQRFLATRDQLMTLLTDIVKAGQETGSIRSDHPPELVAWVAFSIYQVELRRWLTTSPPSLRRGLRQLEKALKLLLDGASRL